MLVFIKNKKKGKGKGKGKGLFYTINLQNCFFSSSTTLAYAIALFNSFVIYLLSFSIFLYFSITFFNSSYNLSYSSIYLLLLASFNSSCDFCHSSFILLNFSRALLVSFFFSLTSTYFITYTLCSSTNFNLSYFLSLYTFTR